MKVYLCGPINGCTDDEASNWRDRVKSVLGDGNCVDPMRRDYRGVEDQNVEAIVDGDVTDILASSVVLANCWHTSWGTAMEIHLAHQWNIPVIAVVPPGSRVSPWLRYHARIETSLDDALTAIRGHVA